MYRNVAVKLICEHSWRLAGMSELLLEWGEGGKGIPPLPQFDSSVGKRHCVKKTHRLRPWPESRSLFKVGYSSRSPDDQILHCGPGAAF